MLLIPATNLTKSCSDGSAVTLLSCTADVVVVGVVSASLFTLGCFYKNKS